MQKIVWGGSEEAAADGQLATPQERGPRSSLFWTSGRSVDPPDGTTLAIRVSAAPNCVFPRSAGGGGLYLIEQ